MSSDDAVERARSWGRKAHPVATILTLSPWKSSILKGDISVLAANVVITVTRTLGSLKAGWVEGGKSP